MPDQPPNSSSSSSSSPIRVTNLPSPSRLQQHMLSQNACHNCCWLFAKKRDRKRVWEREGEKHKLPAKNWNVSSKKKKEKIRKKMRNKRKRKVESSQKPLEICLGLTKNSSQTGLFFRVCYVSRRLLLPPSLLLFFCLEIFLIWNWNWAADIIYNAYESWRGLFQNLYSSWKYLCQISFVLFCSSAVKMLLMKKEIHWNFMAL